MTGVLVPVSKSAVSQVGYGVRHATRLSLAHPKRLALIAGTGTGAIAAEPLTAHHAKADESRAGAAGGIIGWGAHQAGPYPVKWQARRQVKWNAKMSELDTGPEKKTIQAEQKLRGRWQRGHQAAGTWNKPASRMYRDFPAEHRRAKTFRAFGYTHGGRLGEAISTASIATGAAAGVHISRRRQDGSSFSKRHRVENTAGAATVIAANHRLIGRMVDHGVRMDPVGQRVVTEVRNELRTQREALPPTVVHHVAQAVKRYPVLGNRTVATVGGLVLLAHANRRR